MRVPNLSGYFCSTHFCALQPLYVLASTICCVVAEIVLEISLHGP